MITLLICPDSFKGSLTAPQAAAAISRGIHRAQPDIQVIQLPLADGGEGTVDAFVMALNGSRRSVVVQDPLGHAITAEYGLVDDGRVAIVGLAQASGLTRIPVEQRDPTRTSTYGTGEVILAACHEGVEEVWIGLGGSGTNDGGAGIAAALGYRLLDVNGDLLPPGGLALAQLDRIDPSEVSPEIAKTQFRVMCDVSNPLIGSLGASAVYGPQKGATPEQVNALDVALTRYAEVIERDLGVAVAQMPGGGAAGGTGAGLVAFLGAQLESGAELMLTAVKFHQQLGQCDGIVTGEGRFDIQSFMGKLVSRILAEAEVISKPVLVLAGRMDPEIHLRLSSSVQALELVAVAGSVDQAIRRADYWLEELAFQAIQTGWPQASRI